jgi:ribonuclease R
VKYKQAEYLQDRIGQVFEGIVSGVLERGIYVELNESKCEGMIRISEMGGKWTAYPDKYTVMNEFGETIRLGDTIKIVIKAVDLEKKQIDFIKFN